MKRIVIFTAVLALLGCFWISAQVLTPDSSFVSEAPAASPPLRSADELDQMLGSIALYPDPLLVEMLTAATQPADIVMANRYVQSGKDAGLVDAHLWDSSVKALVRYPEVLRWMDENLTWASAVGEAFAAQPADVMNSIQRLRARARNLGNLQTTPENDILSEGGVVEIVPTDPDTLYLPAYDPAQVYFQPAPPDGSWIVFGAGFPIGVWLVGDFDWRHHHVILWPRNHPRPPWWWHRPPGHRGDAPFIEHGGVVWKPRPHISQPVVVQTDHGWIIRPKGASRPIEPEATLGPNGRPFVWGLAGVQSPVQAHTFTARGQESRGLMPIAPHNENAAPGVFHPSSGSAIGGHAGGGTSSGGSGKTK